MKTMTVSIIGASGYSGAELLKILLRHPAVRIGKLFANSSAGKRVDEIYPWFRGRVDAVYEKYEPGAAAGSDAVFIALPSGEAMSLAGPLVDAGIKVIDLGGDLRLKDAVEYERYYKKTHTNPSLLGRALYAMPELNRAAIPAASLISNPGCYPTSAIIPMIPLLREGLVETTGIVVSSMSGVSGAGRASSVDYSFTELNESVKAYKVGVHQHQPEIAMAYAMAAGAPVGLTFVPHLIPITRGIYTTIYAQPKPGVGADEIGGAYAKHFAGEPFVRWSATAIPEIKNVVHTNFIDCGFRMVPEQNRLVVLSVIDNLVKGAAGQAVQNFNLICGLDETAGLF